MPYSSSSLSKRGRSGQRRPRALHGLVSFSSLQMLQASPSYYVALIETYNSSTHARSYSWTGVRYLSFWDMNTWDSSLSKTLSSSVRQAPMMYYWDGGSWIKLMDDTTTM